MKHIENIALLFSKKNIENPLLETIDAGELVLSTGNLIACDPLTTRDMKPFETLFPIGKFPVYLYKELESQCIAYAEVRFSDKEIELWNLALTEGQNPKELKEEEIFGYPVESGMGCFMDEETQYDLNDKEESLFMEKGDQFLGIYEDFFQKQFLEENGAIHQFASLKPKEQQPGNIIAFETGYGTGFYASYVALDKEKKPVKIVTEFIEVV